MPSRIDTVLFDLDGTLLDSIDLILASYRHTMQAHLGRIPPERLWLAGIGTPLRVQLAEFTDTQEQVEAMLATFRNFNIENHDRMARPYDGIVATLDALKARGIRLGLVTSKVRVGADRGIRLCGWQQHFSVIVCSDDVDRPKPDPQPVELAVEGLGADPGSTVFVGDSLHDMQSGRRAGVITAAALWGPFDRGHLEPSAPDYWLSEPGEVLALC